MSELGIPAKLIRLCRMTLSNSRSVVKVGMDLSEPFDTVRGFRQGDPLSCDLFNFVMESVLRKAGPHRSGTIFQKSVQLLAYADDIDIIGLPFDSTEGSSYISLGTSYDVDVVSVRKQLDTFLKDSATAMDTRLSQDTLHDEVEEVA